MISVYFVHRTITPENSQLRWEVEPALVPAIGDQVTDHFGLGERVTWTVAGREWSSAINFSAPACVTLFMVGPITQEGDHDHAQAQA